jgi:hypothetical protein
MTINMKPAATPTATPTPNPGTTPADMQYNAHGMMYLRYRTGDYSANPVVYYYDCPNQHMREKASYGFSSHTQGTNWDIGGPIGNYRIYNPIYRGGLSFYMSGYMYAGDVRFEE